MYVEMDFNTFQVLTFVVYQCIYIRQIVLDIISYLHCSVHKNWFFFDATFNSPDNQDWLFFKYNTILAGCLQVQKISVTIG